MADNATLKESIENAANEQVEQNEQSENQQTKPGNQEETVKSESKETETTQVDLDPEIEKAVNFYRALTDPSQQNDIIRQLAINAGLIQNQQQKLTQQQEKDFVGVLEETLGEEYPDLKEKLKPIFRQLQIENDRKLEDFRAEIRRRDAENQQAAFESEFSQFITKNEITEQEAALMLKEIEVLPPNTSGKNKIGLSAYLGKIYKLVASEKRVVQEATERTRKIEKNSNDRVKNLSSDVDESRLKKGSALPSIRESIAAAAKGIQFDE